MIFLFTYYLITILVTHHNNEWITHLTYSFTWLFINHSSANATTDLMQIKTVGFEQLAITGQWQNRTSLYIVLKLSYDKSCRSNLNGSSGVSLDSSHRAESGDTPYVGVRSTGAVPRDQRSKVTWPGQVGYRWIQLVELGRMMYGSRGCGHGKWSVPGLCTRTRYYILEFSYTMRHLIFMQSYYFFMRYAIILNCAIKISIK